MIDKLEHKEKLRYLMNLKEIELRILWFLVGMFAMLIVAGLMPK